MIRKLIGSLFLIIGIGLMSIGGYQLYTAYQAETSSLGAAKELVDEQPVVQKPASFAEGEIIGLVSIERLGFESAIVEGVNDADLIKGAGHMQETALPGESDKIVIAGHRNQAFGKLEHVEVGDRVKVETIYGTFTYQVREMEVVDESQTEILTPTAPKEELVMFTCYPFVFGAPTQQRYVVYSDLVTE